MYFQSVLVEDVRAPHTRMPRAGKTRMQFTPRGFRMSCSRLVIWNCSERAPTTTSLAGALNTPRSTSVFA